MRSIHFIFVVFGLLVFHQNIFAQVPSKWNWSLHSTSNILDERKYVDYANVEVQGEKRFFWLLTNYQNPVTSTYAEKKFLSSLSKNSVNCNDSSMAMVSFYYYQEQFAHGALIYQKERDINEWQFATGRGNSGLTKLAQLICQLPHSSK